MSVALRGYYGTSETSAEPSQTRSLKVQSGDFAARDLPSNGMFCEVVNQYSVPVVSSLSKNN